MRYGPVKRVDQHAALHQKVKALFSAFTLFTLYAFFAAEVDQREIPSNYFIRDAVDLFLLWMVDYPDARELHATYGVPPSVMNRMMHLLTRQAVPLTLDWINGGDFGEFDCHPSSPCCSLLFTFKTHFHFSPLLLLCFSFSFFF